MPSFEHKYYSVCVVIDPCVHYRQLQFDSKTLCLSQCSYDALLFSSALFLLCGIPVVIRKRGDWYPSLVHSVYSSNEELHASNAYTQAQEMERKF